MERMDRDMPFLLQYEHVAWFEKGKVRILDRRVYPTEVRFVVCTDYHEVVQAIADMVTQSAGPYTAVGMGMALAAWQVRDKGAREQEEFLRQAAYDLAHARPTTANRYGQITCRCADVAKETLAAGRDPVEAIVASTVESLNRRYSTPSWPSISGCPTMSPASRPGRSGRRTTSSSRCGTPPKSSPIGGSPTRSPG